MGERPPGRGSPADRRRRHGGELAADWAAWIAGMRFWDLTATLTFDPKRRPVVPPGPQRTGANGRLAWPTRLTEAGATVNSPMAPDVAQSFVRRWLRTSERANGEPVAAVVGLEYHKNGWPHFHALLGGNSLGGDVQRSYLEQTWRELAGYCRIEAPRSVADCAAYASKYLVKDLERGTVLLWPPGGRLDAPAWPRRSPTSASSEDR